MFLLVRGYPGCPGQTAVKWLLLLLLLSVTHMLAIGVIILPTKIEVLGQMNAKKFFFPHMQALFGPIGGDIIGISPRSFA